VLFLASARRRCIDKQKMGRVVSDAVCRVSEGEQVDRARSRTWCHETRALAREESMDPEELRYSADHEWVKVEGKQVIVGITEYAQSELGDIVYVELPEVGTEVVMEEELTEIESTKTTSPVLAPVSGKIVEVNEELKESPQLINEDPYGKGWIVTLKMTNPDDLENLMSAKEYEEFIEQGSDDD
jgi:glycine cleavage system H protein